MATDTTDPRIGKLLDRLVDEDLDEKEIEVIEKKIEVLKRQSK